MNLANLHLLTHTKHIVVAILTYFRSSSLLLRLSKDRGKNVFSCNLKDQRLLIYNVPKFRILPLYLHTCTVQAGAPCK